MLTEQQLKEIKEHLENAQNPIFLFDNDPDGLCSFLLLQRYIGRGRGVSLRGHSSVTASFFKRVEEFNADYIFVLDRAVLSEEFIKLAKEANILIVAIDHHDIPHQNIKFYYNTFETSGKSEPTSYLCYRATGKKEDLWLAMVGSIADCFVPEFLDEFRKKYPELVGNYKGAFDIRYNTDLGKIIHVLAFGLFDKTSNVVSMIKFLMKVTNPQDILQETKQTKSFLDTYEIINKKVEDIVSKAEENIDKKKNLLYFTYGGQMSISQPASDKLNYRNPKLSIVLGFIKGDSAKFSLRGSIDIRTAMLNSIKDIEGATGGGHKNSCGAQMIASSVPEFKEKLLKEIEKMNKI